MDQTTQWFYNLKAQNITKTLLAKEYDAILVQNLDDIKSVIISKISNSSSIVLDQSPFIESLNFYQSLTEKNCEILDRKSVV